MARARILVVDDDELVLATISRVLRTGHDLVLAGSGAQALALLDSDAAYDLVLCDLSMPHIGGATVYEEVALRCPELARRFVFMHGGATTDHDRRVLELVDRPALHKPFTAAELRLAVDGLLACDRSASDEPS
jgi:CheY-like chemotaxis protein